MTKATALREITTLTARVRRDQAAMRSAARRRRRVMLALHDSGQVTYDELAAALGSRNAGFVGRELARAREENGA
jgi:NADH dehydrogenase FAD-containing subunit